MVVNKKIEKKEPIGDVEAYLAKGGQSPSDMVIEAEEIVWKTVCLRIPLSLLEEVDGKVKKRAALTRTAWVLEAIQQKLKAEGDDNVEGKQGK